MGENWKCPNCGYVNEHYLIVCICGQRKGQAPIGYLPPKTKTDNETLKKTSADSSPLWICPSCIVRNSNDQLICKCGFNADEAEIKTYSVDQTASNLHNDVIFNSKMGNKPRAAFLQGYLLKRFPDSKEAMQEKGNTQSVNNADKISCPHCEELISESESLCPFCAESIDDKGAVTVQPSTPSASIAESVRDTEGIKPFKPASPGCDEWLKIKMSRLNNLLADGLITQKEYDDKKQLLLNEYLDV